MDANKKICHICNENNDITKFTCNHYLCCHCLHNAILYNKEILLKNLTSDFSNLKCPICKTGETSLNKLEALQMTRKTRKIKPSKCQKHDYQLYEFFCLKCDRQLCYSCFKEHKSEFPKHKTTTDTEQANNFCKLHTDDEEINKFICLNCNVTICALCKEEEHKGHKVMVFKTYLTEKLVSQKEKFSFTSTDEIIEYIIKKFNPFKARLKEQHEGAVAQCKEMIDMLNYLIKISDEKFKVIDETVDTTQKLIRTCYEKHFEEIGKLNPFSLDLGISGNIVLSNNVLFGGDIMNILPEMKNELAKIIYSTTKNNNNDSSSIIENLKEDINGSSAVELSIVKEEPKSAVGETNKDENYLISDTINYSFTNEQIKSSKRYKCVTTLYGHMNSVYSIIQLKDGRLASASKDKTIRIWDLGGNYNCTHILQEHSNIVWSLHNLSNGSFASASADKTIRIWSPEKNFKSILTLKGHSDAVICLCQIDELRLASGSKDNSIKIWNLKQGLDILTIEGHSNYVWSLINLKSNQLLSASYDMTIRVWDINSNFKSLKVLKGHSHFVWSLLQLNDERIASGSYDNTIRIWDPSKDFSCTNILKGHTSCVLSIVQLYDGKLASSSEDKTIRLWNTSGDSFECLMVLRGHTDVIWTLMELKDKRLVSGSKDQIIKIWEVL
jgi:WD40 repeat protein